MRKSKNTNPKWTITYATVDRAICAYEAQGKPLSLIEIQNVVRQAATSSEPFGNLQAVLLRNISKLLWEVQQVNNEGEEVQISSPTKPQYEVWVVGVHKVVDDISEYEKKKDEFNCWVALDEKKHISHRARDKSIGPTAIKILIDLLEHIGKCKPFEQVLWDVWEEELGVDSQTFQSQKNRLEVQLTKLEQFCGGGFRDCLFADKFNKGLGIRKGFSDKYFIFRRLS